MNLKVELHINKDNLEDVFRHIKPKPHPKHSHFMTKKLSKLYSNTKAELLPEPHKLLLDTHSLI